MGLEAATFINQLNAAWPIGASDPKAQGDDHLRLIKSTLQATFPNIAGAVTATHTQLNNLIAAVTGLANPSATIGLAAVNGVATTGMRSDGAPPLSQAIVPTWTGVHTFASASGTWIANTNPSLYIQDTDSSADSQLYRLNGVADALVWSTRTDANGSGRTFFQVARTGIAVNSLAFGNATDNNSYSFLGTGLATFGGAALINSSISLDSVRPIVNFQETDQAVDEKRWRFDFQSKTFSFQTVNDAVSATRDILSVVRGTGIALSSLAFGNATDNPPYNFLGTGVFTTGGVQRAPNGAVGAPAISFTNDTGSGDYRIGANNIGRSINGALVTDWVTAASGAMRVADRGGTLQTVGYRNVPQNSQSGNYGLVGADEGKHILHPSGGGAGDTYTIPANASVGYDIGTVLTFVNRDSNSVSIAITSDTLILAGTTSTGTRTLAQNGVATAIKVESTTWIISGTGIS